MNVDYVQARERMVQEQLVSRGINDPQVLRAMAKIPRHLFLEKELWDWLMYHIVCKFWWERGSGEENGFHIWPRKEVLDVVEGKA